MKRPPWRNRPAPELDDQPEAAADPETRLQSRWTGGSALATRGATALLWAALLTGPVGLALAVGGASAAPDQPSESAAAPVEDRSDEQSAVEEFAAHVITTWLETPDGSGDRLAALVQGGADAQLPETPFVTTTPAVAGIELLEHGVWSVTVGVTVAAADPEVSPARRYFQVPVRYDRGALVALTLPAPMAAPPRSADLGLGYEDRASLLDAPAVAAQEFLTALLTGTGAVTRYVTPGAQIESVTPAPYRSAEVVEVRMSEEPADPDNPEDGHELKVLVTAVATAGDQQAITVQYALSLLARAGRWEVSSIDPAPAVAVADPGETSTPEPPAPTGNPAVTTPAPTTTPAPSTAPTT